MRCRPACALLQLLGLGGHAASVKLGVLWEADRAPGLTEAVRAATAGRDVELLMRDAGAEVDTEVERMAAAGGLVGFLGPGGSGEARFAARAATLLQLPLLSPSATAVELGEGSLYGYFRRPIPDDGVQCRALAAFLGEFGHGKAAVFYDTTDTYSSGLFLQFAAFAPLHNVQVTPLPCTATAESAEAAVASLARSASVPSLRLIFGMQSFVETVLAAARSAQPPQLGPGVGWLVSESAGVNRTLAAAPGLEGLLASRPAMPSPPTRSYYQLALALGREPTVFEATAFDCATALLQAAEAAGAEGTRAGSPAAPWARGPRVLELLDALEWEGASSRAVKLSPGSSSPYSLVNAQGASDWDTVGTFWPNASAELSPWKVRWPGGVTPIDPNKIALTSRLRGRTLPVGRSPRNYNRPDQVATTQHSQAMLDYISQAAGFTYTWVDLPCNLPDHCIALPAEQVARGPQSWDSYACQYYGSASLSPDGLLASLDLGKGRPFFDFDLHWTIKNKRQDCGVRYSPPHYTFNFRLYARRGFVDRGIVSSALLLMWPFDLSALSAVMATALLTALGMYFAERHIDGEHVTRIERLQQNLYVSLASILGASNFTPTTRIGKMIIIAWMITVLTTSGIYTAELAAILTAGMPVASPINSVDGIVKTGSKLCFSAVDAAANGTLYQYMVTNYPKVMNGGRDGPYVKYLNVSSIDRIFPHIRKGVCHAGLDYDFLIKRALAAAAEEGETYHCELELKQELPITYSKYKSAIIGAGAEPADVEALHYWITRWSGLNEAAEAFEAAFPSTPSMAVCDANANYHRVSFIQLAPMLLPLWALVLLAFCIYFVERVTRRHSRRASEMAASRILKAIGFKVEASDDWSQAKASLPPEPPVLQGKVADPPPLLQTVQRTATL